MNQTSGQADLSPSHTTPLFVVLNAGSGNQNADAVARQLAEVFAAAGQRYELLLCRRPGDLAAMTTQAIRQALPSDGVVVAAGGDGTISHVAQAVVAAGSRFGVIPLGTFNYFARDNGLPLEVALAAEALVAAMRTGSERQVQVGLLNDRVFLVNASVGLYPQLLADREALKQQHGRSRIVAKLAGLLTLLKRDIEMLLHIEYSGAQAQGQEVLRASTIFVGNNALQLEDVGFSEESHAVKHGQIAIIALPPLRTRERVMVAVCSLFRQLGKAPDVTHFACRQLDVEPLSRRHKPTIKVAMDGEVSRMTPPLNFRVGPRPLRLVVSAAAGDDT